MSESASAIVLALAIVAIMIATLFSCTARERAAVARTVADLAAEVCVTGDSVSVCLRKCGDEHAHREAD